MPDGVPNVGCVPHRPRALLWRFRWLVVAVCVAVAAWVAIGELRPAPPATVPVLVAAHDLPAGSVLTASDLRVAHVTDAPGPSMPIDDAIGARLIIGAPAGLAVVPTMLLGPGLADSAPPGWVVAPVTLADPVLAELLRVGDSIDLYLAAADTGGQLDDALLVSTGALVLATQDPAAEESSWLGTSSSAPPAVVVAVRPADAAAVTGASGFGPFRAVLSAR